MNASTRSSAAQAETAVLLAEAERLAGSGRALDAIDLLRDRALRGPDSAVECKLAEVRYRAFRELPEDGFDQWPVPIAGVDRSGPGVIPEIEPADLDADGVRRQILSRGSVLVRGLLTHQVDALVSGIDRALASRTKDGSGTSPDQAWHQPLQLPENEAQLLGRRWVAASGGVLACDSPRVLHMLLEAYTDIGLRDVVSAYLGERPVLSANKCTLRRVPITANTDWHQDGAFLGDGIRALNVWVALTDCGVDAPGIDLVPRRFDEVVETGTGGAIFDWAVGPETVTRLSPDIAPVRPQFRAGDALLFDDLFLHRTALDPSMTRPRHAIESWFFARTSYPSGQVPIVW
jgi:hypothetical protein